MSFQTEVISFLTTLGQVVDEEPWGICLPEKHLGFKLQSIDRYPLKMPKCPDSFQIVYLWEDLWRHKREVVESRIASLLGKTKRIHARDTIVVKLTKPELLEFLEENHLSVPVSAKYKLGLTHSNELVAVATFSASCPVHRGDEVYASHELVRFCNKKEITVVGGLSKLVSHFIKSNNPDDIMSYADLDWSKGKSYTRLGFTKIGELPPQTFYVDPGTLERFYKINAPEAKLHLLAFQNQGSHKYLLDLKKKRSA